MRDVRLRLLVSDASAPWQDGRCSERMHAQECVKMRLTVPNGPPRRPGSSGGGSQVDLGSPELGPWRGSIVCGRG